jgi:PAS domain S-box-containing protein
VGLDHNGQINYTNPFFSSLTGYTATEVLGQCWLDSCRLPIPDANPEQPPNQDSLLTKSGEERLMNWNHTRLQDADGHLIGTISIGEDITERRKIERMKQDFISVVSHELRTPLTSIRGSLGLIAGGIYDHKPEKIKEMIAIAARQSDRLVRLVNDMLDLRRLESGQSTFNFKQTTAASLIQQSVEVMRAQAEQHHLQIFTVPTTAEVWADGDAVVQTLTNLLSNAIKFSPPNTIITIRAIAADSDPDSVSDSDLDSNLNSATPTPPQPPTYTRFSVQDQGRGIPAEHLETIFGQFQQVDASDAREKGGTGLGLAICRTIVEQHTGKIWVHSQPGEGSTFFFMLPAKPISTQPDS